MNLEEIVLDLTNELDEQEKQHIKSMLKTDLIALHHGLGRYIRNHYKLWHTSPLTENWRTDEDGRDIRNGVDYSLNHPDAVSMRIIEMLWEHLNQPPRSRNYADSCEPFHHS